MFAQSTILGAIVGFAFLASQASAVAVPLAGGEPEHASQALETRVWRSYIDVEVACDEQHGPSWAASKEGNNCGDWKCVLNGEKRGLNMDTYCIKRYQSNAYAMCNGGVFNWACHDRT
jgi:hypothetical protein